MNALSIRVLLVDDHPILLAGIANELEQTNSIEVVGTAANSTEMIALLDTQLCDVVVSDYAMPGGNYGDGIALFSFLRSRYPSIPLVVLTMMDNPAIIRSLLKLGISCILSKSDAVEHVVAAIYAAHAQGKYLSPTIDSIVNTLDLDGKPNASTRELSAKETEVVRLFVSGLSIGEIAMRLHRAKQTVSTQKSNAMRKLGVHNDVDLLKFAIETNLVPSIGSESI